MKRYFKFFSWAVAIAILALFITGIIYRTFLWGQIEGGIAKYGYIGLFVLVFLLDFLPQYISTYAPVTSALLFGMDPFAVCIVSIFASGFGSLLAFEIGLNASRRFINDITEKKEHKKLEQDVNKWGKWIMLLGALTPLPYVPMIFGALKITRRNFYIYGVAPRIASFIITILALVLVF